MKEVSFKKLIGKNFLSIGNVPLVFSFPSGLNIISGYNYDKNDENGVGKTTVIQLFFWVLFGDVLSNLKKDEIVNDINKKDCYGCLEFEVTKNGETRTYKIERGVKPSFCKLFIGDKEDETLSSISSVNEKIQSIISSTPTIFRNCITLSINDSIPFMAQKKPERKAFVESIFRLEVLKYMDKSAKNKYNELVRKQELNLENQKVLSLNKSSFEEKKNSFDEHKKQKLSTLESRKIKYKEELDILQSKIVNECSEEKFNEIKNSLLEIKDLKELLLEKVSVSKAELSHKQSLLKKEEDNLKDVLNQLNDLKTKVENIKKSKNISFNEGLSIEQKEELILDIIKQVPVEVSSIEEKIYKLQFDKEKNLKLIEKIKKYGSLCSLCDRPFSAEDQQNNKSQIEELQNELKNNDLSVKEFKNQIANKNQQIESANVYLRFIEKYKSKKQLLENVSLMKSEIDLKNKKLIVDKTELQSMEDSIKELSNKKDLEENIKLTNISIKNQIKNIESFLSSVDADILELNKEKNTFDVLIAENEEKLNSVKNEIDLIMSDIKVYDNIKFIVSDDGIKSYIIKKLIKVLNERIEYYLKLFDSNAKLKFDEFFDDILYNDKNLEKSYDNFSGGERKRIDLACLFSFLDIRRIQGDVRFNVIFFDELLDSAISSKACEFIFNVLKERYTLYNESSYIITHRKEFKNEGKNLIDNMILLEKRNGFTRIGENNEIKV
jgi:DNA repair exonuclease SbcCD ATPase subunit